MKTKFVAPNEAPKGGQLFEYWTYMGALSKTEFDYTVEKMALTGWSIFMTREIPLSGKTESGEYGHLIIMRRKVDRKPNFCSVQKAN